MAGEGNLFVAKLSGIWLPHLLRAHARPRFCHIRFYNLSEPGSRLENLRNKWGLVFDRFCELAQSGFGVLAA